MFKKSKKGSDLVFIFFWSTEEPKLKHMRFSSVGRNKVNDTK